MGTAMVHDRQASLTGVRAFAALLVVATHAAFWTGNYTDTTAGLVGARLEIGVAVFFALSGFLLFRPWLAAAANGAPPPSTRRYLSRRAWRVLPAYWVVVLAAYAVFTFHGSAVLGRSGESFLRHLTLTQIYGVGHAHTGLTQMWSLAVEASFYLLLPLLAWLVLRRGGQRTFSARRVSFRLAAVAAVTPAWLAAVHYQEGWSVTAPLWLPTFVLWFVCGMALAVAAQVGVTVNPYAAVSVSALVFLAACTPLAGEPTIAPSGLGHALAKSGLYALSATALLSAVVLRRHGTTDPLERFLASAPMVWLGTISYELFLVHLVVIEFVMRLLEYPLFTGSAVGVFVVTTAFSVPVAWLLHRLVPSAPSPAPTSEPAVAERPRAAAMAG